MSHAYTRPIKLCYNELFQKLYGDSTTICIQHRTVQLFRSQLQEKFKKLSEDSNLYLVKTVIIIIQLDLTHTQTYRNQSILILILIREGRPYSELL